MSHAMLRRCSAAALSLALTAAVPGLGGCATAAPAAAGASLAQRVQTARNPADHQAIASEYERLAAEARERAASHRAALAVYQHGAQYRGPASRDGTGAALTMPAHCEELINSEDELARGYTAMAQEHRRLARPEASPN